MIPQTSVADVFQYNKIYECLLKGCIVWLSIRLVNSMINTGFGRMCIVFIIIAISFFVWFTSDSLICADVPLRNYSLTHTLREPLHMAVLKSIRNCKTVWCAYFSIDYRGRKRHVHRAGNADSFGWVFTERCKDHSDRRPHAAAADYQVPGG